MSAQIQHAEQTRPATETTWWLWIAASAVIPILGVVPGVAIQRKFGHHFDGQFTVLTFLIISTLAAPAIIQWAVLRRLVPQLTLGFWLLFCWPFAILAFVAVEWLGLSGMKAEAAFDLARYRQGQGSGAILWAWLRVIMQAAAVALLYNIVPVVVFGWLAKRSAVVFLVTIILGACIAAVLHKLYFGFRYFGGASLHAGIDYMRAQSGWSGLAAHAGSLGPFGMVQGAVGGWGLMRMFPADPQSPTAQRIGAAATAQVFGVVALLLAAGHGWRYAAGPSGIKTGFPEVRRMLSSVPAGDVSQGAPILRFSHKIDLPTPIWFTTPSPDGRMIMLATKERALRLVDVEQRSLVGAPLLSGETVRSVAWSPDGRFFAVNQPGQWKGSSSFGHQRGQIRLFSLSGLSEVSGVSEEEQNCALSSTMSFSEDGQSIWVMCERTRARPNDLLALRLRVPSLQIVERWPGPGSIAAKGSASFADIMPSGTTAFASMLEFADKSQYVLVLDVTKNGPLFTSRDVEAAELGGPGFGFCGLHLSRDAKLVTLANCALPAVLPKSPVSQAGGQFRTFDIVTGNLVSTVGRQSPGQDIVQWSLAYDRAHGRLVGVGSTQASKGGTLVVWDQQTGEERQRIETKAFRAGKFSLDGRSLSLLGRDEDTIYLYRAE